MQVNKANKLKKSLQGQQKMISIYKDDSEIAIELSFKVSEAIAEKGKAFSDGEFVKHSLAIFSNGHTMEKVFSLT